MLELVVAKGMNAHNEGWQTKVYEFLVELYARLDVLSLSGLWLPMGLCWENDAAPGVVCGIFQAIAGKSEDITTGTYRMEPPGF